MNFSFNARNVVVALVALGLVLLPVYSALSGNIFILTLFTRIVIFALAAASLNLIMGYGGMMSFGHAAYLGIGGYAVGILAFVTSWNSYILPLFLLSSESNFTLPLGTQSYASQYAVDTARVLAFTSLSMIPALIFFSAFERRIVGGLTGAVKG